MEYNLSEIREKGDFLNSGNHRTAYKVNDKVIKIAHQGSEDNNTREIDIYEKYKDKGYFNCCRSLSYNNRYIECDYCESLTRFLKRIGVNLNSGRIYDSDFRDMVKEYPVINQFLVDAWDNIERFCVDVLKLDIREINFSFNLGYNERLNKIVIIDYAE